MENSSKDENASRHICNVTKELEQKMVKSVKKERKFIVRVFHSVYFTVALRLNVCRSKMRSEIEIGAHLRKSFPSVVWLHLEKLARILQGLSSPSEVWS